VKVVGGHRPALHSSCPLPRSVKKHSDCQPSRAGRNRRFFGGQHGSRVPRSGTGGEFV